MKFTLAFLAALASFASGTALNDKRDAFSDEALNAHNTNRARYGAPPLKYDNDLAAGAASYAAQCKFGHSGGNFGENLYAVGGPGGPDTIADAVKAWMDEAAKYDYNNPGFSGDTGHFTQVVWKSSTTLGCAVHRCTTGNPFGSGDWSYAICRYTPAGNVAGQFPQNVGRPM